MSSEALSTIISSHFVLGICLLAQGSRSARVIKSARGLWVHITTEIEGLITFGQVRSAHQAFPASEEQRYFSTTKIVAISLFASPASMGLMDCHFHAQFAPSPARSVRHEPH